MNHSKEYVLSQLRHAYMHLKSGTVNRQAEFADGLLAPAIRYLEETGSDNDGWNEMEGYPEDGTAILGFFKDGETSAIKECYWDMLGGCWIDSLTGDDLDIEPIRWRLTLHHPHLIR